MKHASVAELKARLSEYLVAAKRGEDVIVTDRGRPVARLSGLTGDARLQDRTEQLIRTGLMRPARKTLGPGFWEEERPSDPEGRSLDTVLREREDGR